ncbi:MAG: hypothetical protein QXU47_05855 [Candidatus Bathyarchaeia archaeon]
MIGYYELKLCWVKGVRNGNLRRLTSLQKSYYRACLIFARRVGRIVSVFVVSRLKAIMNVLVESPKASALEAGLKRVYEILSSRVLKWAPQVKEWLREESFILYLGFMEMNNLVYFKS